MKLDLYTTFCYPIRPLLGAVFLMSSAYSITVMAAHADVDVASAAAATAPVAASGARAYQTPTWTTYYSDIDAIRADTEKAQAELDNLTIHHKLEQARVGNFSTDANGTPTPGMSSLPGLPAVSAAVQLAATAQPPRNPQVEQVSMVDGQWTALIRLSSGARVNVHQGQSVSGIGKITAISLNQVVATEGGKSTALAFAGDTSQETATTSTSATSRMPAIPFGMH